MYDLNHGWRDAHIQRQQFQRRTRDYPMVREAKHIRPGLQMILMAFAAASIMAVVACGILAIGAA